jgi:hypothetical protein
VRLALPAFSALPAFLLIKYLSYSLSKEEVGEILYPKNFRTVINIKCEY